MHLQASRCFCSSCLCSDSSAGCTCDVYLQWEKKGAQHLHPMQRAVSHVMSLHPLQYDPSAASSLCYSAEYLINLVDGFNLYDLVCCSC